MSQYDFGTINTSTTSGSDLATLLQNWRDALLSNHIGGSRPSYVKTGQLWINNTVGTNWAIYFYDGADDILVGYVNTTDNTANFLHRADVVAKTASASIAVTERNMTVAANATSGAITLTLPAAATAKNGFKIVIQKRDNSGNAVTIARAGSDLINGAASLALSLQYDTIELVSDGVSAWVAYGGVLDASITAAKLASGAVTTPKIADANVTLAKLAADVLALLVPAATVVPYAGPGAPNSNWLLCYGQAVSRTTYAALYAALGGAGSPYGQGDGTTTFNVPDLRGRGIAGKDNMGGVSASRLVTEMAGGTLGAVGGAEAHTLDVTEIPAHQHFMFNTGVATNAAGTAPGASNYCVVELNDGSTSPNYRIKGGAAVASGGLTSTPTVAGGLNHNNVQPTMVMNYIIKT